MNLFSSSYRSSSVQAENRTRQFLVHWLGLFETLDSNPEAFRSLLDETSLSLGFRGTGIPMTSFKEFAKWIRQRNKRLLMSQHHIRRVQVLEGNAGLIRAFIDFDWRGKNMAGIQIGGKLRHEWTLLDTGEDFLRMKQAKVTMLEPIEVQVN